MKNQKGQSMVALLFFVMMSMAIATAAIFVTAFNSLASMRVERGEVVRQLAETGIEYALLALLREENYAGETLILGDDQVEITISGGEEKTIISRGISGEFIKEVEVITTYSDNVLRIVTWKEIY